MFYTYAHTKPDGTIFYIGKGAKRRAWETCKRNPIWKNIVKKYNYNVEILAYWDTEIEAFDHEKLLISCFQNMGYKLANLTGGGEGIYNPSVETRKKMSKAQLGENNSFFGRFHTEQTKNKLATIKKQSGKDHPSFKGIVVATNIKDNETLELFGNKNMILNGFDPKLVSKCLSGKHKSHKGYTFKRLEKK